MTTELAFNFASTSREPQGPMLHRVIKCLGEAMAGKEEAVAGAMASVLALKSQDLLDWDVSDAWSLDKACHLVTRRDVLVPAGALHEAFCAAFDILKQMPKPILTEHRELLLGLADVKEEQEDDDNGPFRAYYGAFSDEVRLSARALLHNIERDAGHAASLVSHLNDKQLREDALYALGLVDNLADYIEPVVPCLQDADDNVVAAAECALRKLPASELARFPHNSKVLALLEGIADSDEGLRELATPEVTRQLMSTNMALADGARIDQLTGRIFQPGGVVSQDAATDFRANASILEQQASTSAEGNGGPDEHVLHGGHGKRPAEGHCSPSADASGSQPKVMKRE